jgi:hypothetical protein
MIITFKIGNYTAQYEDAFKPGDLITAYQKGYHYFVRYEHRGPGTVPLIVYKKAFNLNGKACKSSQELKCDAAYCRFASEYMTKSIEEKKQEILALETILKSI